MEHLVEAIDEACKRSGLDQRKLAEALLWFEQFTSENPTFNQLLDAAQAAASGQQNRDPQNHLYKPG